MGAYKDGAGVYKAPITPGVRKAARAKLQTITEPAREVPVLDRADVLVVGGGPSGTAAAIAAARLGARVILVERYNHLGGLSTGGLVIWIDRMTDWGGQLVMQGIGGELLDRLPADAILGPAEPLWGKTDPASVQQWKPRLAAFNDTVTWSPMIDPEQLKAVSLSAVREAGAILLFHAWASAPIVEGGRVTGIIFESKQGRFAILSTVTIDSTGDGDIFAAAGEQAAENVEETSIHHCMNTAWLWGGVDIKEWLNFRQSDGFAAFSEAGHAAIASFDTPDATWRDDVAVFMGPRFAGYNALDVQDLTEVELRSRDKMMELLAFYRRHAPGFARAWILLSAPQIGIRHSRRLVGQKRMTRDNWVAGVVHGDEIGVSPSLAPKWASVSVPYGSLLPRTVDGLLVPGRHLSSDPSAHTFMREIPQCWVTGHAAGVGAALAVQGRIAPRAVDIRQLQQELRKQGAYLRTSSAAPPSDVEGVRSAHASVSST